MRLTRLLIAMVLLSLSCTAQALDVEAQAAKKEGMRLYNIHKRSLAPPYLEISAKAGDVESMYYLGEIERLSHMSMTQAALNWYLKAAEHADPYAMLRLHSGGACVAGDYCPEDAEGWREKAEAITLPKAELGDTDAMVALYSIYAALEDGGEGMEWLERAAEAGNPKAQYLLGSKIKAGYGWYFLESRRLEGAEKWLRKSAEQGNVPAMSKLSRIYEELGVFDKSWSWKVRSSNNGHADDRLGVGWCYLNPLELNKNAGLDRCQNKKNVVKGWAILTAMVEGIGNSSAKDVLQWNENNISNDQKKEAEKLAKEWLNKEPPLSKYPPRYGF